MSSPVNFTDPSSGRRLGFFDRPKRGSKVMPRATPTLAEVTSVMISEYRVFPRSALLRQSGWAWLGCEEFVTTSNTCADTSKD